MAAAAVTAAGDGGGCCCFRKGALLLLSGGKCLLGWSFALHSVVESLKIFMTGIF